MLYETLLAAALAGTALTTPVDRVEPFSHLKRQAKGPDFSGDTQNMLTQGGANACKSTIIVFARGTTESGNVGTIVGPDVFQAIAQKVGANNLAVQGVDYPANVQGFLAGGDDKGSQLMAKLTQQAVTQCPNSSVIMSGYSQGGQLTHNAAKALPAAVTAKVAGALIFGDPNNGTAVQGVSPTKTLVICHDQDNICQHGSQIRQAHLTYGTQNAGDAANFVAKIVGTAKARRT